MSEFQVREAGDSAYNTGPRLFLDLYRTLGEEEVSDGLSRPVPRDADENLRLSRRF